MKRLIFLPFILLMILVSCTEKSSSESSTTLKPSSESEKVTFIELGSVNCIPCQAMVPIMEQMEEELGNQVEVLFYDVWTEEGKPYAQQYGIRVIPTQIFLDKSGNEYFRHEGFFAIEEVYPVLEKGGVTLP
ncbi:thioredoxin [Oceanispirochaeta crateris]|uniref:Thioredoxin n=1 Tax=Oceanispirochaeta crateris TaxID=2518645 RepID=A0A5C1QIW3_9SPIO|nr:thioredoxin family protein [Oceanispirochaeta crateris]QEN07089.1 thioredoxin [Oceanispirochaeta crateris]